MATQGGLSRFDGTAFTNYVRNDPGKHRLCGTDVREIIEDTTRQVLWVLCGEIGINAISTVTGNVVQTIVIPYTSPEDWNICMLLDGNRLWIGTSTGVKVYHLGQQRFEKSLVPPAFTALPGREVRTLARDRQGNVWACYSGYGMVAYHGQSLAIRARVPLAQLNDHRGSKHIRFFNGTVLDNGHLLFATSQGLRETGYDPSGQLVVNTAPCASVPLLNREDVRYVYRNKQGAILVATNARLYQFDAAFSRYVVLEETARRSQTDWLASVQCIYDDQAHNTWLGCQGGLAFISAGANPFQVYSYDRATNHRLDHVWSVLPLADGGLLAGLRHGLVHVNGQNDQFSLYDEEHEYHYLFSDPRGLVHASRPDGMYIYRAGRLLPVAQVYPEFAPFSAIPVNSHVVLHDSLLVLGTGTSNGILLWNPVKHTIANIGTGTHADALASGIVKKVFLDSRRNVWVLSDNIITIFSAQFRKLKEISLRDPGTAQPYSLFFDVCEARGSYWLAAYGFGIIELDPDYNLKSVYNTSRGLSSNEVYQLYHVSDRQLVATSNYGLSVLNLTADSLTIKNYFERDGLHSDSFEEACGVMHNGRVYAGGVNGFTVIDPKSLSANPVPPKVYVHRVKMETHAGSTDTSNFLLRQLTVPGDVLQTTVYFAGLNYANPERTTFAYRIHENESDWIQLNGQNFIQLIGLSPGTYTFRIRAANEDGVWSAPVDLRLVYLPKWYQTGWFKAALVCAGFAIGYGFYRLRLSHLQQEHLIRTRLAGDLHDDLGGTLNSVKVYASLALMEKGEEVHLFKVKESTQEAIDGLRDMIWVLDDRRDYLEDLVARINHFAVHLCKATAIRYQQKISDEALTYKLGREEKRNLYMVIKEAINNSIKYAEAREICLEISLANGKPVVSISDDGKGFDGAVAGKGNGLQNMQHRAAQIHYGFSIGTTSGTSIRLQKL